MHDSIQECYDEVAYGSEPITPTNPNHMGGVAALFGHPSVPPSRARILELGCARGDNLIAIAAAYPSAECVGIDISPNQIAQAVRTVRDAGVPNCTFLAADIRELPVPERPYDYVIAHGVFSWVPRDTQESLLSWCGQHLSPEGLLFLSYNTLPGWHTRLALREMMLFESRHEATVSKKPAVARRILNLLAEAVPRESPYGRMLHEELQHPRSMPDWYLTHDFMAEFNEPQLFYQLMERATQYGLHYVADAEVPLNFALEVAPAVRARVQQMAGDRIAREQYLDFVRNRMFRRSIFAKASPRQYEQVRWQDILESHVRTMLQPAERDEKGGVFFRHPNGGGMRASDEPLASFLTALRARWPKEVLVREFIEAGPWRTSGAPLVELMTMGISAGLVDVVLAPSAIAPTVAELPRGWGLARACARTTRRVPTLLHTLIEISASEQEVLRMLDGAHTLADVSRQVGHAEVVVADTVQRLRAYGLIAEV